MLPFLSSCNRVCILTVGAVPPPGPVPAPGRLPDNPPGRLSESAGRPGAVAHAEQLVHVVHVAVLSHVSESCIRVMYPRYVSESCIRVIRRMIRVAGPIRWLRLDGAARTWPAPAVDGPVPSRGPPRANPPAAAPAAQAASLARPATAAPPPGSRGGGGIRRQSRHAATRGRSRCLSVMQADGRHAHSCSGGRQARKQGGTRTRRRGAGSAAREIGRCRPESRRTSHVALVTCALVTCALVTCVLVMYALVTSHQSHAQLLRLLLVRSGPRPTD